MFLDRAQYHYTFPLLASHTPSLSEGATPIVKDLGRPRGYTQLHQPLCTHTQDRLEETSHPREIHREFLISNTNGRSIVV